MYFCGTGTVTNIQELNTFIGETSARRRGYAG
jgi:hypothetical protein